MLEHSFKKTHSFGNLGKFQKVKTCIQYIKFTTAHKFLKTLNTTVLKTVIFQTFFGYPHILLQKYGTNQGITVQCCVNKCSAGYFSAV